MFDQMKKGIDVFLGLDWQQSVGINKFCDGFLFWWEQPAGAN